MNKQLTPREELLVELVWFLAYGNKEEVGLDLKDTKNFLTKSISSKNGRNCLECIRDEGREFINEVIAFVNELDGT